MKHTFSYRIGFILAAATLIFVVGTLAGTRFVLTSADSANGGLLTDLKSAVAPEALAGWDTGNHYVFQDYANWPSSTTLRGNDTLVRMLAGLGTGSTVMDINGDGLPDLLQHSSNTSMFYWGAVFLNNGNLQFSLAYKCFYNQTTAKYYGDCAG